MKTLDEAIIARGLKIPKPKKFKQWSATLAQVESCHHEIPKLFIPLRGIEYRKGDETFFDCYGGRVKTTTEYVKEFCSLNNLIP